MLHLLAVATRPGSSSSSRTSTGSPGDPLLCDLKPGGRYVAPTSTARGGVPLVIKRLKELGALHEDELTVTGQTIGEVADAAEETPGQDVVRPVDQPLKPEREASRSCAATSRPRAAW